MPLPNFRNNNVVNPGECPASLWRCEPGRADSGCGSGGGGGETLIMTRLPVFIMTAKLPVTAPADINTIPSSSSSSCSVT